MLFTDLFESFDNDSSNLQLGDEVLVTYPNQFQGKRGEITGFGRDKAFVIVEINGREYSMHSSDVERLGGAEDWDNEDEDYGTFGDDERDELDEYGSAHDKVTFEVDSENAYNHIMHKYGNVIDWAGDYMTVPARYWPAVQELAFAAGGDVQEIELSEGYTNFGAVYAEQLAQKVFDERPNFSTKGRADELVDYAYRFAVQDLGKSRARYEFNYDEDFLSDFVSAYGHLQREHQGVAEGDELNVGIEAYGVRGASSKKWRKTFKSQAAFEHWLDANEGDIEVLGTREVNLNDMFKEGASKNLNKRVRVVKTGETGTIRQIKHGAFKGAPKTYYVDLDNGKQADNLPASALRLIKDQGVAEGSDYQSYLDKYSNSKSKKPLMTKTEFDTLQRKKEDDKKYKRVNGVIVGRKGVAEGDWKANSGLDTDQLAGMIAARLERLAPNVFTDYGVEYVLDAVRDVAEFYAMSDFEELGTSDLGAMARSVVKQLKQREAHMNRGA